MTTDAEFWERWRRFEEKRGEVRSVDDSALDASKARFYRQLEVLRQMTEVSGGV